MDEKKFLSIDEQIELLIRRGVDVVADDNNGTAAGIDVGRTKAYARNVLNKNGYYNLINGYGALFRDTDASEIKYKPGTTIYEIHALFQFDRVLRNIFFRYSLEIENNIKSLISYYFSQDFGHKNYLLYTNFNTNVKDAESKITKLIAEIQGHISYRSSDPSIAHYLKTHGYIPLWVLNNILTFGAISKFYSLMKQSQRQAVSREYHLMDNALESMLFYLSGIRNFCAHGNRLYCYRTTHPLITTSCHDSYSIPKNNKGEYLYGKRDLFAGLICLRMLLSKNDYNRLKKDLRQAFKHLRPKLKVLQLQEIMEKMGFPDNWDKI